VLQRLSREDAQRRQRDILRHREVVVRKRERERERQHIEADAGANTQTTTKMRKRKNKRKKNKRAIETHTRLMGPRRIGLNILERPGER
jgi:hypothetical protein